MNTLIIEDERPAALRLVALLHDIDSAIVVAETTGSIVDTVAYLRQKPAIDLIFSDVQLSDGLSFEIFRQVTPHCPLVFTTAYDEYAIQAFKLNSLDYLLKPILARELSAALAKFRQTQRPPALPGIDYGLLAQALGTVQRSYRQRFLISYRDTYRAIATRDVAYFFSEHKITRLICPDGTTLALHETLDQLSDQLDPAQFFRASRQCIVSVGGISAIHKHFNGRLKLDLSPPASDDIFVSRDRADALKYWLNQ